MLELERSVKPNVTANLENSQKVETFQFCVDKLKDPFVTAFSHAHQMNKKSGQQQQNYPNRT